MLASHSMALPPLSLVLCKEPARAKIGFTLEAVCIVESSLKMRFAISKPKFGLCRIECICVCTDCPLSCLLYFVCRWGMLSDYPVGWCLDRASPEERVLGGNRPAGQKPGDRLS